MKTPIQKRISEIREIKEQCRKDNDLQGCLECDDIIVELHLLLPAEEEALKESCSEGWGIGCNSIPVNVSRWFENKYGKDE